MGIQPRANNMGVLKRMDPPQSESMKQDNIITDGTDIIMVVVWKKILIPCPIPVINIWCAHTRNDIKPRKTTEYTRDL
jgi:hypothetical protein